MPSTMEDVPNLHIRDYQRKKVYDAEELCSFWNQLDILLLSPIQLLVSAISEWADIPCPKIYTGDEKYPFTAYATMSKLVLPFPISKSVPFICHEMSHVINYQRGPADHHGPYFAKAYLEVVNQFMGKMESEELKQSFNKVHVKYIEGVYIRR